MGSRVLAGVLALAVSGTLWGTPMPAVAEGDPGAAASSPLRHLVGALHEHSAYSDGWPGTRPSDYFAAGKDAGLDFLGAGEHSDNLSVPVTFSEGCLGTDLPRCIGGDEQQPADSVRKWDAMADQARAATDDSFTAFRGFEWTSDRFNHINVYFSENVTNAKADGGYATLDAFWRWLTTPAALGGGDDGLATFNHPGSKKLVDGDSGRDFNNFAYVPQADARMVGIEVFNRSRDYGSGGGAPGYYVRALDAGWHVGAIGAEDSHGEPGKAWAQAGYPKTVILAPTGGEAALRAAMLARSFYAVRTSDIRLDFIVDGAPMGTRLDRPEGAVLRLQGSISRPDAVLQVVTSGGRVVAEGTGALDVAVEASQEDAYYFLRASVGVEPIAYSSPVWVRTAPQAPGGEWLAGDLHVHTCYSHDGYCPPDDDNTGPDEAYALSGDVEERFFEASARGLDFLAITDHNDVRSVTDPGFGSYGVIGVPGYENSLRGHAQMLGATARYDNGDREAATVNAIAADLRARGGVFQINHPMEDATRPIRACEDALDQDWRYGYEVTPDTIEVWNISHLLQPPIASSNEDAVRYWECWLERSVRVAATGGSDSHWVWTGAIQGPGNPTTWVFASERSATGVLEGLRAGRTSISLLPPGDGGGRLVLEADGDGDGTFESIVGDTVPPGSTMRVRAEGMSESGVVEVRANSETLLADEVLVPGGEVRFTAPDDPGWIRATLSLPEGTDQRRALCDPVLGSETTYCRDPLLVVALTSPIYTSPRARPTVLTIEAPATGAHTDPIDLEARLTDANGSPLAGAEVSFAAPGDAAAATTDENGYAGTTLVVQGDPGPGELIVSFAGTTGHSGSEARMPFEVVPETTALTYIGDERVRGRKARLAAVLTEDDGPVLAGRKLLFEFEGDAIEAITDTDGIAEVTIELPRGFHSGEVEITFGGEVRFGPSDTVAMLRRGGGSPYRVRPV